MEGAEIVMVTITRFEKRNEVVSSGETLVAAFDVEVRGIRLPGCAIFRNPDDGWLRVVASKTRSLSNSLRNVTFLDPDLHQEFRDTALRAYRGEAVAKEIVAVG